GSWVNGASDVRVKLNVKPIENPKSTMRKITAATWNLDIKGQEGRFGIGVLANGLYDDYPEASINVGDKELSDGTIISDVLSVQAGDSGVLAAVHHATILELMDDVDELKKIILSLKSK
ncbi:tail fiber domain-containing protein, partial [Salmonella enterica]|nr:tail fiber domain-containing protein [Salmonella enterica]ECS8319225.1 tail fiber domain-containing protein [Salmonella enterica subsp. enterica serovar Newport]EBA4847428.1 tail fiber domain-containing protein [Salmonella enterica]EHT7196426.1 tail fiber domain-containing protein [Salmonella enterica]EKT2965646.1 tail fiber domain-containing protein [Salmonella enterica]